MIIVAVFLLQHNLQNTTLHDNMNICLPTMGCFPSIVNIGSHRYYKAL